MSTCEHQGRDALLQTGVTIHWSRRSASSCFNRVWRVTKSSAKHQSMLLDEEANAALVRVLSPLLPVLDFDVYTARLDAMQTAAAVRPSIVSFFMANRRP